jgi:hypothetical protein
MNAPEGRSDAGSSRGCLLAALVLVVLLVGGGVALYLKARDSRRRFEEHQAAHRQEEFDKVKAGDDGRGIFVFLEPKLTEMLASDPDCIANLKVLHLVSVDTSGPESAAAAKLVNVREVGFYGGNADPILAAMKGSPALEAVNFEVSGLSDEGVRTLATFPNLKKVLFQQIVAPEREVMLRKTLPGVVIEIR